MDGPFSKHREKQQSERQHKDDFGEINRLTQQEPPNPTDANPLARRRRSLAGWRPDELRSEPMEAHRRIFGSPVAWRISPILWEPGECLLRVRAGLVAMSLNASPPLIRAAGRRCKVCETSAVGVS